MCLLMEEAGIPIKYHHPEVGAAGQFEIEPKLGQMSKMADATMMIKYIIRNTALKHGKTATLMPKPVYGEAGNGMHVHMLLLKDGEPVFSDDNGYSHLSETAHYFPAPTLSSVWFPGLKLRLLLDTRPPTAVPLSVFPLMQRRLICAASNCVTPMQPAIPTSVTQRS